MNRKSIVPTLLLVGLSPALQGAGCTAHYTARMTGTVSADEGSVVVMYRVVEDDEKTCAEDATACLGAGGWRAFVSCEAGKEAVLTPNGGQVAFELCTHMVGLDYRADVLAFIDANGNRALDPGERYGLFTEGPMTRHGEANRVAIAIDQTR